MEKGLASARLSDLRMSSHASHLSKKIGNGKNKKCPAIDEMPTCGFKELSTKAARKKCRYLIHYSIR